MKSPDVVEQAPPGGHGRGRGRVLLVALVLALVAGGAAWRVLTTREPDAREPVAREERTAAPGAPVDGRYLTLSGRQSSIGERGRDHLIRVRTAWSDVQIVSVTPLDPDGAEAPHLEALVLDAGVPGQSQLYGLAPAPTPPVLVGTDEGAAVGLRVPEGCAVTVEIVALRFRLVTPRGPAEQVVRIDESEGDAIETGTGCAGSAPSP